jgi:hypothetical protein
MTAETLNGASLHDEMAYSGCLLTKNSLKEVWEWLSELSTMFNSCTLPLSVGIIRTTLPNA